MIFGLQGGTKTKAAAKRVKSNEDVPAIQRGTRLRKMTRNQGLRPTLTPDRV